MNVLVYREIKNVFTVLEPFNYLELGKYTYLTQVSGKSFAAETSRTG